MGRARRKSTPKTLLDLPDRRGKGTPPTPEEPQAELNEELRNFCKRVVWGDEAVAWGDVVVHRDVVVQGPTAANTALPSPSGAPVSKLQGKEWIRVHFERRYEELAKLLTISEAGDALAEESETAPDCRGPLSKGYCINELRKFGVWKPKPRNSSRPRPK